MINKNRLRKKKILNIVPIYFWIISYFKSYIFILIIYVALTLLLKLCDFVIPSLIQIMIDDVIGYKDLKLFVTVILCFLMNILLIIFCTAINNLVKRKLEENAVSTLRYDVLRVIKKRGVAYYEGHPTGETLALINSDVNAIENIYKKHFPNSIALFFTIAFSIAIVIRKNILFVGIIVICYAIAIVVEFFTRRWVDEYSHIFADAGRDLNRKIYDSISAIPELKAFGAQKWDLNRLILNYKQYKVMVFNLMFRLNLPWLMTKTISVLGLIAFYIIGVQMCKKTLITVGEFVELSLYIAMSLNVMLDVMILITQQNTILHQAAKLYSFMMNEKDEKKPDERFEKLEKQKLGISFLNVHFGYTDKNEILKGVSFHINEGEKVAFVGSSGEGKSTILKLIAGFYQPHLGKVLIENSEATRCDSGDTFGCIGYVFQETYLFGTSIKENIRYGRIDATDVEVIHAAKIACAHDFIVETPEGYDTEVGERGVKLSGGQKQRISIARMILKNCPIIILDEATSALDTITEQRIKSNLNSYLKNKTVIAVSHRISTIKDYNRILVVDDGKVKEEGNYGSLIEKKGIFYRLISEGHLNE